MLNLGGTKVLYFAPENEQFQFESNTKATVS